MNTRLLVTVAPRRRFAAALPSAMKLGLLASALAFAGCAADMQTDAQDEDDAVQSEAEALSPSAQELPFTEFTDPNGIGTAGERKTRLLITSAARYARVFGHDAPADVDFAAGDAVIFYSAGVKPTGGYDASVLSIVLDRHRLHVTTRLESPGANCIVTQSLTKPNVLVVFRPTAAVRFVRFRADNTVRDCNEPAFCGGIAGIACPDGQECIDDPNDDCDPNNGGADCGGICVPETNPGFCGGIAGFPCPDGQECIDDPSDTCDPNNGGADCGGICVPKTDACATVRCKAGTECQVNDQGMPACVAVGPFCGGIAARPCPGSGQCIDNPTDSCDPNNGGADCGGICTCVQNVLCARGLTFDSDPKVCACVSDNAAACAAVLCPTGTTCEVHDGAAQCISDGSEACGKNTCSAGMVCCNPSCGVCVKPGMFCTQQACL